MPINKDTANAVTRLFNADEKSLEPQLLKLITETNPEEEVTVIPAQNEAGVGEIVAVVSSLTNQDMYRIEREAGSPQAYEAYTRKKKTLELIEAVKKIHFWDGETVDLEHLPKAQRVAWWDLQNTLMFDLYYDKCIKDVREEYRKLLLSARLREDIKRES